MNPLAFLQAQVWKIATGASVVVIIALTLTLMSTKHELSEMRGERDKLNDAIYRPVTGWSARLNQCQTNTVTLDQALRNQNEQIRLQALASAEKMAKAETALGEARKATQAAQVRVAGLMQRLVGGDTCSRVFEMDKRLLETLQ